MSRNDVKTLAPSRPAYLQAPMQQPLEADAGFALLFLLGLCYFIAQMGLLHFGPGVDAILSTAALLPVAKTILFCNHDPVECVFEPGIKARD